MLTERHDGWRGRSRSLGTHSGQTESRELRAELKCFQRSPSRGPLLLARPYFPNNPQAPKAIPSSLLSL